MKNEKARAILKRKAPAGKARLQSKEKNSTGIQTKGNVRDKHRKLWGRVNKMFRDSVRKKDKDDLKFVEIAAGVLLDITKGEGKAWGLADEDCEAVRDGAESFAEEMERFTVPLGAGAALDGKEEV